MITAIDNTIQTPEDLMSDIEKLGFCILVSSINHKNKKIPYAYTVGLTNYGVPELFSFTDDPQATERLFCDIANAVRCAGGVIRDGEEIFQLSDRAFSLKAATVKGMELERYVFNKGDPTLCYQLVWADDKGLFPWDKDYDTEGMEFKQRCMWDTVH